MIDHCNYKTNRPKLSQTLSICQPCTRAKSKRPLKKLFRMNLWERTSHLDYSFCYQWPIRLSIMRKTDISSKWIWLQALKLLFQKTSREQDKTCTWRPCSYNSGNLRSCSSRGRRTNVGTEALLSLGLRLTTTTNGKLRLSWTKTAKAKTFTCVA